MAAKTCTKKCDICNIETSSSEMSVARYGDWITSKGITVHYFCLLLSSNLPQRGEMCTKFLGFNVFDIRAEIRAAAKRICVYCLETHASIACHDCKDYFHLTCGDQNHCLFTFHDEFHSYCDECCSTKLQFKDPSAGAIKVHHACFICYQAIGEPYSPVKWVSAPCCGNGYVHRVCMLKYARAAGYYLKCIWCGEQSFRNQIRSLGIFVPDHDANWEKQKDQYSDLYRGHKRCDIEPCLCPRGRDYTTDKWTIILCSLCGSSGAHNPICVSGNVKNKIKVNSFKCNTCACTEMKVAALNQEKQSAITSPGVNQCIDTSMYVTKQCNAALQASLLAETTASFSDDGSAASTSSAVTVIPNNIPDNEKTAMPTDAESERDMYALSSSEDEEIDSIIRELKRSGDWLNVLEESTEEASTAPSDDDADETHMETSPTQDILSATQDAGNTLTNSEIVASTSQDHVEDNIVFLKAHELDDAGKCVGTTTIRIDMSEPRFANKTMEEIENSKTLITEADIIERSTDKGIVGILEEIKAEYAE